MTALPAGLTAGTWNVDGVHSEFAFVARHAGVSKVRGTFEVIGGAIEVGETLEESRVTAEADAASITTGNEQRDGHLQSGDFLLAEENPKIVFTSSAIENVDGPEFDLRGTLSMRGVEQEVVFKAEFNGVAEDPYGNTVAGFSATATVNRKDFGMSFEAVLKGGELLVSDKVAISIEIEAVRA
ncbi:YceI family protein [Brevibacterium album]|uniref:YceI family protein n=1 Tax=Brevibacterium album TaxID=417948 RepID=UPI0003FC377E|nr:YceI family protein [Brevibacterium album]